MGRWTDLAAWVGPTPNQSGPMVEYRGVVIHTAEGYYKGTISWQQGSANDVSSHFIVAGARDLPYGVADGTIGQMVDTDVTAWTQRAGNGHWLSIECSGFGSRGDKLSAAQIEACARILAEAHTVYGVPLQIATNPTERGLGHHSMDREGIDPEWGHDDCPGLNIIAQKPLIVARAIEIIGGDDMSEEAEKKINDLHYAMFTADSADRPVGSQSRDAKTSLAALKALVADVAELKARPAAAAAPVDAAALKAALLDPEVVAVYAKAAADLVHADLAD